MRFKLKTNVKVKLNIIWLKRNLYKSSGYYRFKNIVNLSMVHDNVYGWYEKWEDIIGLDKDTIFILDKSFDCRSSNLVSIRLEDNSIIKGTGYRSGQSLTIPLQGVKRI